MHLVTHTGILSTVQSTAPHGTASARTLCSSTARVHEHHPHVFYPLVKHLANFFFQPQAVEIRESVSLFFHMNPVFMNPSPKLRWCVLAPLHLRRTITRPVSYYALFECVAASEPTS